MKAKKIISFLIMAVILLSNFSVYAFYDVYEQQRTMIDEQTYTVSPGLTYTETTFNVLDTNFERAYYFEYTPGMGTNVVTSCGQYIYGTNSLKTLTEKMEEQGLRVVGGINGDFYSMKTGIPLSAMIQNGEIITSDDNRLTLGFDKDGKAIISKPEMHISLKNDVKTLNIAHINKYPLEWGLYLLTDSFYPTTKSTLASYEIVLMPYSEKTLVKEPENYEKKEETELISKISGSSENLENPEYETYEYTKDSDKLYIGCDVNVVVKEIRKDSLDSKIPEGCFVLCAENVYQGAYVENMQVGDEFLLSVDGNEEWENVREAIGASGGLILSGGEYIEDVYIDHYTNLHPRTAAGVRENGEVVFFCVDGRKKGSSCGMSVQQVAYELKRLGCITAINLDGGGSTTVYSALTGKPNSSLQNIPSDISERRTANSILFVNNSEKIGNISKLQMYPNNIYVFSKSSLTLGDVLAADENYFPVDISEYEKEFLISGENSDSRIVDNNKFLAGTVPGRVNLESRITKDSSDIVLPCGYVSVINDVSEFSFFEDTFNISPFESITFDADASFNNAHVAINCSGISWNLDGDEESENIEYHDFDESGLISGKKGTLDENGVFTPSTEGETYNIYAKAGNAVAKITVSVDKFPFSDSREHWSAESLYDIYKHGLMQGERTADETLAFKPDRTISKAEFLTVLARMLKTVDENFEEQTVPEENNGAEEISSEAEENTTEEPTLQDTKLERFSDFSEIPDWSLKYIDSLDKMDTGLNLIDIISKTDADGNTTLNARENISRLEVLTLLGALCDDTDEDFLILYPDTVNLKDHKYSKFINNALAYKIFSGYLDGTIRTENPLTRAEAATVLLRYEDASQQKS